MLRQIIVTFVGHVDHGKTSLLDKIRGSAVAKGEAGGITQSIGCTVIPKDTVKRICGRLLEQSRMELKAPGFLFIDSPGHAAFTNLRKRGGALADIAVLVVDINEGFKPQTVESIDILKSDRTPFVVAANKIDLIQGWSDSPNKPLISSLSSQPEQAMVSFENKLYEIVGKLHELGFQSERFDRVQDYTKQVAIVPVSAFTGEGIPELLLVISGLAQRYLSDKLNVEISGSAKGTILEIKEEKGLGTTADAIIYDGTLKVNDIIVIGGITKPVVTKVRALLEPLPLVEMRLKKAKFNNVKEVSAATGVKIAAPDLDKAVAGMPLRSCDEESLDTASEEVQKEIEGSLIETDDDGLIVKADTLGGLEAVLVLLREKGVPVKSASIGSITKKDITAAEAMASNNPLCGVVLGFNVEILADAQNYAEQSGIPVILNNVIYRIIEDYEEWKEKKLKAVEVSELDKLVRGGKFRIMPGYVFRQNNPAVVGVEVINGQIKTGNPVMNADGRKLSTVKNIQEEKEPVGIAEKGKQVAVSLEHVTVGRQINEGDILYVDVPENDFRKLKEFKHSLKKNEIELLKEIAEIKRKDNPVWGV